MVRHSAANHRYTNFKVLVCSFSVQGVDHVVLTSIERDFYSWPKIAVLVFSVTATSVGQSF